MASSFDKRMQKVIDLAREVAAKTSPGVEDTPMPKPGQPIPVQHFPVPGFADGGKAVRRAMMTANAVTRAPGGRANANKWSGNRDNSFETLGNILEGVRGTVTGRMVNAYQGGTGHEATHALYGDLHRLAKEGKVGRKWYERSSKRILQHLGGDKNAADKFAQLVAIYSPQTTVPVNTVNAMKAYNRASAGHTIWNGNIVDRDRTFRTIKEANDHVRALGGEDAGFTKVPLDDTGKRFLIAQHRPGSYENIATADRDLKAHLVMNENIPFEGRKTNNFYNNLMVHIDPKRLQGSTQDLWMAKAFGFHDPAVGNNAKYDYMERLTEKLANDLGWKPHQVQAAIWTAMKTRQESVDDAVKQEAIEKGLGHMIPGKGKTMKFELHKGREGDYSELMRERALGAKVTPKQIADSARDFSDFLDQNLAHVSWEATPSNKIQHFAGFDALPPEAKADYHTRISKALQDDKGGDLLAKYLGVMSPGAVEAPGYWEGASNPASHTLMGATRIKAAGQAPDIDAPSKHLMDLYGDAMGLLLKQDGVGYHRPYFNPKVTQANGVEYHFEHPTDKNFKLSRDHIVNLGKALDEHAPGASLIPIGGNKVRVLNFSDSYPDQRHFHKAVDRVVSSSPDLTQQGVTAHKRVFASDGDLRSNDWKENARGEDYRSRIGAAGRPDVLEYLSTVLAPRVEAVDRDFAEEHGLQRDHGLEHTLRNLHEPQAAPAQAPVMPVAPAPSMVPPQPQFAHGGAIDHALQVAAQYRR